MTRCVCISLIYDLLVRSGTQYGCIKIRPIAVYNFEKNTSCNPGYIKPRNDSVIHKKKKNKKKPRTHSLSICVDRVPQYHKLPVGKGRINKI